MNKKIMLNFFNNTTIKIFIVMLTGFLFGKSFPLVWQEFFYSISLSLKELLIFVLPVIIFSCLFSCLLSFKEGVLRFIFSLFFAICFSNYFTTLVGLSIAKMTMPHMQNLTMIQNESKSLEPLWSFSLPTLISNNMAVEIGVLLGFIFIIFKNENVNKIAFQLRHFVTLFLNKIFIPVLPFFAFGFIIKLQVDNVLENIVKSYLQLVLFIILAQLIYILFLYLCASNFNLRKFTTYLKNIFPAGIMGLSTMSSLASLPLSIQAAEKNTKNLNVARTVPPVTVNVHLVGDCIAIPLLALAILGTFGYAFPSINVLLVFALYFIMAKFGVAAVPGGGILVMIPILKDYLHFSPEMCGLITAMYILLDPIITTANVLGNGAFVILFNKVFKK